jgi:hypothetical protein
VPTPPEGLPAIRDDSAWLLVLQLCGDAAEERGRPWSVYGGRDFSVRPGRPKTKPPI